MPRTIAPSYAPVIDPAEFSTTIDNPYFPLVPGTRFIYEATTADGRERNVVEVTADTKIVMAVPTRVVHDVVLVDGELEEETFDWYAQDGEGNVWYFGEATQALGGPTVDTSGSFEAGRDGALPGIVMPGHPMVGDHYRQEYYQGEAEDTGKVLSLSAQRVITDCGGHVVRWCSWWSSTRAAATMSPMRQGQPRQRRSALKVVLSRQLARSPRQRSAPWTAL